MFRTSHFAISCFVLSILWMNAVFGQCPNNNTFLADLTPAYSGDTVVHNCVKAGQYITSSVQTGEIYVFTTCGNNGFNTQMTLRNSTGTVWYAFNDNFCGQQSQITWTSTFTGTVRLLLDEAPSCGHDTLCQKLYVTKKCQTNAGTFTLYKNGNTTSSPIFLCESQDTLEIKSNLDYQLPPADSGETAELMYMVFSCQPHKSNPTLDTCFTGIYLKDKHFTDVNPGILATGSKYYLLPVTVDDGDNGGNPNNQVNLDANGDSCYSVGNAIEVTYLSPIAFASNIDCDNKSVLVNVFGGKPEYNATYYSVTNTGSGTLIGLPIGHGGTITIAGLESGDYYSFDVSDGNGCVSSFSGGPLSLPNAGGDTSYTFCSADDPFNLDSMLNGNHDSIGAWYNPNNSLTNGIYTPGTSIPGIWMFVVNGYGVCDNDTSFTQINIDTLREAGFNKDTTICQYDSMVDLWSLLSNDADSSGIWYKQNGTVFSGVLISNNQFVAAYEYKYKENVSTTCPIDSSLHKVFMKRFPNPGLDSFITFCDLDTGVSLFTGLAGNPDTNGVWRDPMNIVVPNQFIPYSYPTGTYTYTVYGQTPCPDTSVELQVSMAYSSNPGLNDTVTFCRTDSLKTLIDLIKGVPDLNGVWLNPFGDTISNGLVDPATDSSGAYTYFFEGSEPCPDTASHVFITFIRPPNPGLDDSLIYCSNSASQSLFNQISGNPDPGGAWFDPNSNSFNGQFNPSLNSGGTYLYAVNGASPCQNDTSLHFIHVTTAPRAGGDTSMSFCNSDTILDLYAVIPGFPDYFGTWKDSSSNPFTMPFNPAVHSSGSYTYNVQGSFPCANDQAIVDVTVISAPNAGLDGNLFICTSDSAENLFNYLNGNPDSGGTWSDTSGMPFAGTYDPSIHPGGDYFYEVKGTFPCADSFSIVNVYVSSFANPGINSTASICSDSTSFNLLSLLNGNPDTIGSWKNPQGLSHSGVFNNSSDSSGFYKYTVPGFGSCSDSSAILNLSVTRAPNPGIGDSLIQCSNFPSIQLFTLLTGNPDSTGTWFDPYNQSFSGYFNPAVDTSGIYTYIVTGSGPCNDSSSSVKIKINPFANAGINGAIDVCDSDSAFNLISVLGGSPATNGTWRNISNNIVSGVFNPIKDTSNQFSYTVTGITPCADSISFVQVNVIRSPNSGSDTSLVFCDNMTPVNLKSFIPGNPDPGGIWKKPSLNSFNGILDPGTDTSGVYLYTVSGQSPCTSSTTSVTVTINNLFQAGEDASLTICENNPPFNFFDILNGVPDINGKWKDPFGIEFDGLSSNISLTNGVYLYTTPAAFPCPADSASVTLEVNELPQAGIGISTILCENDLPFNLFSRLSGNPDSNGLWLDPTGVNASGFFNPGSSASGTYTYIVHGAYPCPNDSAFVNTDIRKLMGAGDDQEIAICWNNENTTLSDYLNQSSSKGGYWLNNQKNPISGLFSPMTDPEGTYYYVLPGNVCPDDTAQAEVRITSPFDIYAGTDIFMKLGQSNELHASSFKAIRYVWKPKDGLSRDDVASPTVFTDITTTYIVFGYDENGCVASDSIDVNVLPNIFVPNTFTPNGDGINEEWFPEGLIEYKAATVHVFSQERIEVFRSEFPGERWNGTHNGSLVPTGKYIYIIEFGDELRFESIQGIVSVLR